MSPPGEWPEWPEWYDWPSDFEETLPEPEWFAILRQAEGKLASDDIASRAFKLARRRVKYRKKQLVSDFEIRIAHYWLDLIETAEAIRNLAIAAIRNKIPTRWFDFAGFEKTRQAAGGDRGFLLPINAVEQAKSPTIKRLQLCHGIFTSADAHPKQFWSFNVSAFRISNIQDVVRRHAKSLCRSFEKRGPAIFLVSILRYNE